ncbi:hypothetical protein CEXT_389751 [Caerostris extrusa]|uniref:Uncharacterized protein n=1 Tax=Caerostris extrusa TaxID=172846 RepID=A0AAV4V999_CAEEX|nr:hypothetical protein CEXT_389751 [Caerostris extrusa]
MKYRTDLLVGRSALPPPFAPVNRVVSPPLMNGGGHHRKAFLRIQFSKNLLYAFRADTFRGNGLECWRKTSIKHQTRNTIIPESDNIIHESCVMMPSGRTLSETMVWNVLEKTSITIQMKTEALKMNPNSHKPIDNMIEPYSAYRYTVQTYRTRVELTPMEPLPLRTSQSNPPLPETSLTCSENYVAYISYHKAIVHMLAL